ncbi:MAG: hypothetical protein AB7D03_04535 [Thiomicrospira sp.]
MSLAVTFWSPEWAHHFENADFRRFFTKHTALGQLATKAQYYPNRGEHFFQRASALFHQPSTLPVALTQAHVDLDAIHNDGFWLLVQPVQMMADRDTLLMVPGEDLAIEQVESRALFDAFNCHFAQDGVALIWGSALRWYLKVPQVVDIQTTPLNLAAYRSLHGLFPQGHAANYWRKLMNETQMLFYTHPVNQLRRAQGKAEINSVWIWGEGALQTSELVARPQAQIWSEHTYLQGMAKLTQAGVAPAVADYQSWLTLRAPSAQVHLIHQPLTLFADEKITDQAREALFSHWEASWFSGLREGLLSGLIDSLYIDLGLKQHFLLTPRDLKRFWRWRNPL